MLQKKKQLYRKLLLYLPIKFYIDREKIYKQKNFSNISQIKIFTDENELYILKHESSGFKKMYVCPFAKSAKRILSKLYIET